MCNPQAPYNILDMDWSGEGYQLWVVNSATRRFTGPRDTEFCPFPQLVTRRTSFVLQLRK